MNRIIKIAIMLIAITTVLVNCKHQKNAQESKLESKKKEVADEDSDIAFQNNCGVVPTKEEYNGPLFQLNHAYPTEPVSQPTPWTDYLRGQPVNDNNIEGYMSILKEYVKPDLSVLINDPETWNENILNVDWYGMPWTAAGGIKEGRDAISGSYTGQIVQADVFASSGLQDSIQNHTLVYYNKKAARTLSKVWAQPYDPNVLNNSAQYEQGAIVIKVAGVTANPSTWPVLEGSTTFPVYRLPLYSETPDIPEVLDLYVLQYDIIVKDTIASPETGWVFSTFIYDKTSTGTTTYDKLTLLGAMWGLDPDVPDGGALKETYINPDAPTYADVTLGYGGRLSGPIDLAVLVGPQYNLQSKETVYNTPASACMSCHGTAGYLSDISLYPSPDPLHIIPPKNIYGTATVEWNKYYINKPGTEAQDPNVSIGLDYDMVMQFALANWYNYQEPDMAKHIKPLKGH